MNAFIIMVVVMAIYAFIGVDIFSRFGESGSYMTVQQIGVEPHATYPNSTIESGTDSGFYYGPEYFGTFSRALFTLFQVMTGESWAEVVARPLIFGYAPGNAFGASFYFVSFIIVLPIVLINVRAHSACADPIRCTSHLFHTHMCVRPCAIPFCCTCGAHERGRWWWRSCSTSSSLMRGTRRLRLVTQAQEIVATTSCHVRNQHSVRRWRCCVVRWRSCTRS